MWFVFMIFGSAIAQIRLTGGSFER